MQEYQYHQPLCAFKVLLMELGENLVLNLFICLVPTSILQQNKHNKIDQF